MQQLQQAGAGSYPLNTAGVAGQVARHGQPGFGSGRGASGGANTGQMDFSALEAAVKQLQALSLKDSIKDKKDRKKDKKSKKKKKKQHHRKDKKKKKNSSSSSSSSRSLSRSSSSSSTSSSSRGKRPLRCREKSRSKQVSYDDLAHVDGLKWKKTGDLVAFASKHPGALTAHFLAGVFARLWKGTYVESLKPVVPWAHQFTGLSELRDLKEVLALAEILDSVNRREIERAMDILCQRVLATRAAKMKGGSREKGPSSWSTPRKALPAPPCWH